MKDTAKKEIAAFITLKETFSSPFHPISAFWLCLKVFTIDCARIAYHPHLISSSFTLAVSVFFHNIDTLAMKLVVPELLLYLFLMSF